MCAQWKLCFLLGLAAQVLLPAHGRDAGASLASTPMAETLEQEEVEAGEEEEVETGEDHEPQALSSESMHKLHSKIDEDKDGKISMVEMMEFAKKDHHDEIDNEIPKLIGLEDTNNDGQLSLEEHLKYEELSMEEHSEDERAKSKEHETVRFKQADSDGNGVLDQNEAKGLFFPENHDVLAKVTAEAEMKSMDTNGDGHLSMAEFFSVKEGDEPSDQPEEAPQFHDADKNSDDVLDLEELMNYRMGHAFTESSLKVLFEIADKDGDGMLTAEELDAERESIAATDAHQHLVGWAERHAEL